ncbi:MAG: septum site-determining protein MinC [Pseudomonadota bacterium]|nr:septum site-determining protein MinC [Pseudomonadota bacterium]
MPAAAPVKAPNAFELKSATLSLLSFTLKTAALGELSAALDRQIAEAPGLYDHEPVVLDLTAVRDADPPPDVAALVALLRERGLLPVAVKGGNAEQTELAQAQGLAEAPEFTPPPPRAPVVAAPAPAQPVPGSNPDIDGVLAVTAAAPTAALEPSPPTEPAKPTAPPPSAPNGAAAPTLYVSRPLRSGQQVYARGGDLVMLAIVNDGAEVIADGSIHVYAPLRGRAVAGARGDTQARIFATVMEPQLVSIAGTYLTIEADLPADVKGKPAQVRLESERLVIEPLTRPSN